MFENKKKIEKIIEAKIQAMGAEGAQDSLLIESMLTGLPLGDDGTESIYRTYSAQTTAIYRKYNGEEELGTWQTRAIIDTRTAFISGEGLSVQTENDKLAAWIDKFLLFNRLKGSRFHDFVKGGEMEGRQLLYLKPDNKKGKIKVLRKNSGFCGGVEYEVFLKDDDDPDTIDKVVLKQKDGTEKNFFTDKVQYVKLGGDASKVNKTTTRCGLVLKEIDNYDRCLNNMRKVNHLFSRPTPYFKTNTAKEGSEILATINNLKWKVGSAFAGPGDFKMVTPDIGALENVKMEMLGLSKSIAFITGIPIHWLGWVDAMSNRATAETLYEAISNATIQERSIWSEAIYEIILKAQELAIDNGMGKEFGGELDPDFQVKIPLISFSHFESLVKSLSTAYNDQVISKGDYQNALPGIDPYKTQKALDEEDDKTVNNFKAEFPAQPDDSQNPDENLENTLKDI